MQCAQHCCGSNEPEEIGNIERQPDPLEDEEINAAITGLTCARAMADAAERYIQHREWVLELERTKFGNGELEDGSENENDENREYQDARPRSLKVRKSMRAIHRDFVARLNLDRAMARGISLRRSLWARPWIYPKADRKVRRLWQSAKKVELFDTFISHVWSTSWRMKFTSLVLQSCWIFMLTSWAIVATLVFFLCFFDVLPLDWRYDAEALGDIVQCQLGPWIVGFSMPACLLGLLLAPYLPEVSLIAGTCFFDAVSIHQGDEFMKQRGLEGLGGFISISKELRALWTPEFASRLWCIFELAAFRKINPSGGIVIAPVSIEAFVAMLMPAATASSILYMFMLAARQTVLVGALVSSVAVFPCGYGVHLLRRDMQCKKDMLKVLENFDLDAADCTFPEDREFILRTVTEWYGSSGSFITFVQTTLREELAQQLESSQVSAFYYFFPCIPMISVALDFLIGFIKAGIPAPWEVSFVISVVVGFGLWVSMATALLLNACHVFSAPGSSWILDVAKTSSILLVWVLFQIAGLICSILCHMTSIWAVFAWSCSSFLLFRVFLRFDRVG
mmetsp:Transcript_32313/g.69852  ORF Transcript_32313/g.69852 Transcript_32313/m.69852 type:complete len:565 (-) Transcript_32313:225-1919(-)